MVPFVSAVFRCCVQISHCLLSLVHLRSTQDAGVGCRRAASCRAGCRRTGRFRTLRTAPSAALCCTGRLRISRADSTSGRPRLHDIVDRAPGKPGKRRSRQGRKKRSSAHAVCLIPVHGDIVTWNNRMRLYGMAPLAMHARYSESSRRNTGEMKMPGPQTILRGGHLWTAGFGKQAARPHQMQPA
jgi:hypothetical protein